MLLLLADDLPLGTSVSSAARDLSHDVDDGSHLAHCELASAVFWS